MTLRYVNEFKDRHGKTRFYFRRHGKAIPLLGEPGSREFMDVYARCLAGRNGLDIKPGRGSLGSVSTGVSLYLASTTFGALAADTRRTRKNELERLRDEHGDRELGRLDSETVERLIAKKQPNPARNFLKALSPFLDWCVREKLIPSNPTAGVKRPTPPNKEGFATWTDEYVERYRANHATGTRPRQTFELLVAVGASRTDTSGLGRQHIRNGMLVYRRRKTGVLVEIPVLPALQAVVDAMPADQLAFIATDRGTPYTKESFGNMFRQWCDEAGIPKGYSAHGLRKYAAKVRAEMGATAPQLMAWFGWLTLREAERYTRAADRRRMAIQLGGMMR